MPVNTFTTIDNPAATTGTTLAFDINNVGQIVGHFNDRSAVGNHGFLRNTDGTFITLDVPLATRTFAEGINDAGQVVGFFEEAGGAHGFLYSGGASGTYTTFNNPLAVTITDARAINNTGQIVRQFRDASDRRPRHLLSGGTFFTTAGPLATARHTTNGTTAMRPMVAP